MSFERASNYLHGIRIDVPTDPPDYNDVMNMSHIPSAPLLQRRADDTPFISIFGVATWVRFEANTSSIGSFFIRDSDGSLQAKGDTNSHHIVVQNVNGIEMLKIIPRSATVGSPVHTFGVVHKHAGLGMIKVAENSLPRTSLQIFRGNGTPITVNSLKIGDYAVYRNKSSTSPLLCTAAAIAFKWSMKQKMEKNTKEDSCCVYFGAILCIGVFFLLLVVFGLFLEKSGCETKKANGYAGYQNREC